MIDLFEQMDKQIALINQSTVEDMSIEEALEKMRAINAKYEIKDRFDICVDRELSREKMIEKRKKEAIQKLRIAANLKDKSSIQSADDRVRTELRMMNVMSDEDVDRLTDLSYKWEIDDLKFNKFMDRLVEDPELDSYWIIKFVESAVEVIEAEEQSKSSYRMKAGRLRVCKYSDSNTAKLNRFCHKLGIVKDRSEEDNLLIKTAKGVLECMAAKGVNESNICVERDLKDWFLEADYTDIMDLINNVSDAMEYHLVPFIVKKEAESIIAAVSDLYSADWELNNIAAIIDTPYDCNWVDEIYSFLYSDGEEGGTVDEDYNFENDLKECEEEDMKLWKRQIEEHHRQVVEPERREKISKTKNQSIAIEDVESLEKICFDSKTECLNFLGCSTATFSKFLKGNSKLNKRYRIVDCR